MCAYYNVLQWRLLSALRARLGCAFRARELTRTRAARALGDAGARTRVFARIANRGEPGLAEAHVLRLLRAHVSRA